MWLHVDNHWLNMAQALVVDEDETSVPPTVVVVFPGEVKRTLTGIDRMEVIEWLERDSREPQWVAGDVLQTLEAMPQPDTNGIEFHIKTPDVLSLRDTLEALTQAVYTQAQRGQG